MAKKEYETGAQIYPNSEFAPEKYYLLGAYVVLFNAISNNTVEYGLGNNNGDQIINDYIANHIDELNAQFNLHLEHIIPETVNGVVKRDSKGDVVYKKDVFKKMLPELIERAKSLSSQMGNRKDGYLTKMMTNDQLRHLLDEKRIKVKGWHEAVRKKAKGKSGDYEDDGKTSANGEHYLAYEKALAKYDDMNRLARDKFGKTLWKGLLTIGAGALTLASAGALLSYGGLALTSIFGSVFNAAGFGGAILGGAGSIIGFHLTRRFGSELATVFKEYRAMRLKRKHFVKGYGDFSDEDGKPRGLRKIKQRYFEDLAIQKYLENGELSGENAYLKKYLNKARRRIGPDGESLTQKKIDKEARYYKYCCDSFNSKVLTDELYKKKAYCFGFKYLEDIVLGSTKNKDFNADDSLSISGRRALFEDPSMGRKFETWDLDKALAYVSDLINAKGQYTGDNANEYAKMMTAYCDKTMQAFRHDIFENAYTSDLVDDVSGSLELDQFKEVLKYDVHGSKVRDVENAITYAKTQANFGHKPINENLGVSIISQVEFTNDSLTKGIKQLGLTDTSDSAYTEATDLASDIISASSRSVLELIDVDSAAIPDTVKNYLNFMKNKKLNATKYQVGDISATVTNTNARNLIASVTLNDDKTTGVDAVRSKIMGLGLTPREEKFAIDALNEQVVALDNENRIKQDQKVLKSVCNNDYYDFKQTLGEVGKFKGYTAKEALTFYNDNKLKSIKPESVQKYIMTKFQDTVLRNLKQELADGKYNGKEGVKNITEFMRNLTELKTLGLVSHKQNIEVMKTAEERISKAVKTMLDDIKVNFVTNFNVGDLYTLLEQTYTNAGLKDYFDMNTVESKKLAGDINEVIGLGQVLTLITAKTDRGITLEDGIEEARGFSLAYLNRKDTGELDNALRAMRTISDNSSYESFTPASVDNAPPVAGNPDKRLCNHVFIRDMKAQLAQIRSWDTSYFFDKYAALLVMKKRCIAMYKVHVNAYLSNIVPTGSTWSSYLSSNRAALDEFNRVVNDQWCSDDGSGEGILKIIDEEIEALCAANGQLKAPKSTAVSSVAASRSDTSVQNYTTEKTY